jgi:tRNA G46 methylase TrmB
MFTRTQVIQKLIHINEKLVFYPKLKRFYSPYFKDKQVSIIDVGSNKGQSIDFFTGINKAAVIFGFEPNRKLYNKLTEKYSINNNINLINKGISSMEGFLEFHENIRQRYWV